jgi:RHS repeat-associated protein
VGALGHPSDDGTGLIYMRARHYDPMTGRFLSEDPALQGINWFSYAGNNPTCKLDYTGRADIEYDLQRILTKLEEDLELNSGLLNKAREHYIKAQRALKDYEAAVANGNEVQAKAKWAEYVEEMLQVRSNIATSVQRTAELVQDALAKLMELRIDAWGG